MSDFLFSLFQCLEFRKLDVARFRNWVFQCFELCFKVPKLGVSVFRNPQIGRFSLLKRQY